MIIGKISMSKTVISGMSEALEISEDVIRGWILADKYSVEELDYALESLVDI